MKLCQMCKETKELSLFSKNKSRKDGVQCYCKSCNAEVDKYYKEHKKKEKRKATCKNENCNNIFETRIDAKLFCCTSCSVSYYNNINNSNREYRFKYEFTRKFNLKKEPKPNNWKRWTEKEDKQLIKLRDKGFIYKDIGLKLGRSSESCKSRLQFLNKRDSDV